VIGTEAQRLAAFDLDGTLLDSASSIVAGVLDCWKACGFELPEPDAIRRIIGLPWEESIVTLLPGAGEREFAMIRSYHDEVARGERTRDVPEQKLFGGIEELLDELEGRGYLLAIITSRNSHRLDDLLDRAGIAGRFVSLKTTDHGPGKPRPDLMLQTLSELGVDRRDTVMIGDTTFDIQMARNAGTSAIGVEWGVHEAHELREAGAHHVAEAVHELPAAIERLVAR
jgi:phosphoglycolate phosphatase